MKKQQGQQQLYLPLHLRFDFKIFDLFKHFTFYLENENEIKRNDLGGCSCTIDLREMI